METTFTYAELSSNRSSQPALSLIEGFNRFAPFITGISPFQSFQSFNTFQPFNWIGGLISPTRTREVAFSASRLIFQCTSRAVFMT